MTNPDSGKASVRAARSGENHYKTHALHLRQFHRPLRDLGDTPRLDSLKPGQCASITMVGGEGALRRRLLDMGLTPGTKVMFRKSAPLGDPIELNLRGYELSLLRADAHQIAISFHDQKAAGDCV